MLKDPSAEWIAVTTNVVSSSVEGGSRSVCGWRLAVALPLAHPEDRVIFKEDSLSRKASLVGLLRWLLVERLPSTLVG